MTDPRSAMSAMPIDVDPAWGRAGQAAGIFAGTAFLIATVAFVIEAAGVIATQPAYLQTGAGPIADEAAFNVASIAYHQQVLWDYILRDGLYFFAYLALIPFGLALREVTGRHRVAPQLAVAFLSVAAIFGCMDAFQTFIALGYWRGSGFEQVAPTTMVTIGRVLDLVGGITLWDTRASNVVLAIALFFVGRVLRASGLGPRWLGAVAWLGAVVLAVLPIVSLIGMDTVYDLLALVVGAVIAPILMIGVGVSIGRAVARGETTK